MNSARCMVFAGAMCLLAAAFAAEPRKVLVFSRCEGYCHGESIAACKEAMKAEAEKGTIRVDFSEAYEALKIENLQKYDVLVLNNTTALKTKENPHVAPSICSFVRWGGGACVIHAAADCFYDAPECAHLVGGIFRGHPWGGGGTWAFKVEDRASPLCAMFGNCPNGRFTRSDEIYQQGSPFYDRRKLHVLISLDMDDPATAGAQGQIREDRDNPVSWIRRYGRGRVFYTTFAHDRRAWEVPDTRAHIFAGLAYAAGTLQADDAPSAPAAVAPAEPDLAACAAKVLEKPYTGVDWRIRDAEQCALGAAFGRAVERGEAAAAVPWATRVFDRADLPEMVRACAARVLLAADAGWLDKVLKDPSKWVRQAAFGRGLSVPDARFAAMLPNVSPELKRAILVKLVQDEARGTVKDVVKLLQDPDEETAVCAMSAVGSLGGVAELPAICASRARGGRLGEAAEAALVDLPGAGAAIFDRAAQDPTLLAVAAKRAEGTLLGRWEPFLKADSADSRKAAWKALGKMLTASNLEQARAWFAQVRQEEAETAADVLERALRSEAVDARSAFFLQAWKSGSPAARAASAKTLNRLNGLDAFDLWAAVVADEKASDAEFRAAKTEFVALADRIFAGGVMTAQARVDRSRWKASASRMAEGAGRAFDGNPDTRWESGWHPKDQWFVLDLGATAFVEEVTLHAEQSPNDTPKGGEVYLSQDGRTWTDPVATCDDKSREKTTFAIGRTARCLKFVATGENPSFFWSIHEIDVKAGVDKARLARIVEMAAAFRKEVSK